MASLELIVRGGTVVTQDPARRVGRLDLRIRDGLLIEVGPDLAATGPAQILDATGCAVIPGLVHGHLHLAQVLFRHAAEDRALLPWLRERIWPLEAAHDHESLRASAELGIAELLLSGATGALDMGTVRHQDAVFEAARSLGFRLRGGKAMMDAGDDVPEGLRESTEASIEESDRLRAAWDGAEGGRLGYAYAPRFVLSCTDALLDAVAERVAAGAHLHTHASESRDEVALVRARSGTGNVAHLHQRRLLSPRATLAHCVHLEPGEPELLARTGTAVAHCPSANLKLASGIADVPALVDAGVNVALGADGAPCNNNLDLWREMKLAALLPRVRHGPAALSARRVLEMATLGGARAAGMADRVGSLEPGKRADLALVDLRGPHLQPLLDDVHTALVFGATAADVRTVLVEGEIVVRDRRLVRADAAELVTRAAEQAGRLRARSGV